MLQLLLKRVSWTERKEEEEKRELVTDQNVDR